MKKENTNKYFEVRVSDVQGRGGFAIRKIPKGQRIIEYTGEIISTEEEAIRYDDENMDRHHTFLFSIDEEKTIDAGTIGSDARYINHSCDPNCEAVNEEGRIFIESVRVINPEEELNYDYSYEQDEPLTQDLIDQYPCYCGAEKCRGTILLYNPPEKKKKKKKPKRRRRR